MIGILCNRCGKSDLVRAADEVPAGWIFLKLEWWPDEANLVGPVTVGLCVTCVKAVAPYAPAPKISVRTVVCEVPDMKPSLKVFSVRAETDQARWLESFATDAERLAFTRGVRAAASFIGVFDVKEDVVE